MLFDTLIKDQSADEVEAVMAHELGHWAHNDPLRMLGFNQLNILSSLSLYSLFLFHAPLFRAFGIRASPKFGRSGYPIIVGISLASAVLAPLSVLVSFLTNYVSRQLEFGADRFAAERGYKETLQSALTNLMAK